MDALAVDPILEAELELELQLVHDAVRLVAGGHARRVVVAGLRHGCQIETRARGLALEAGMGLEGLPTSHPRRIDLAVARG